MPNQTVCIIFSVIALAGLCACVGQFETKPTLTSVCHIDWQGQAGIAAAGLPPSTPSKGLHVLVFNIHDRLLPGSVFSKSGHTEEEVACIGDLASKFDLVLVQEAFVRPAQLARYTGHAWTNHPLFSEGGGGDWWPLRAMCEICLSPGLLMLAREQPEFVYAEPYDAFAGWNTALNKADVFFRRAFNSPNSRNFGFSIVIWTLVEVRTVLMPVPSSFTKSRRRLSGWSPTMRHCLSAWTPIFDLTERRKMVEF